LKKAFKRKAILVHPDKNSAPGSTEAFKKVNAAFSCLADTNSRRIYD
jgi:curved DNA-binding protein CbpA